ncbi:MAG: hypothetical protein LBH43_03880 [Treponema sp.]|nr:hypothetical protein [Treponema sp.]
MKSFKYVVLVALAMGFTLFWACKDAGRPIKEELTGTVSIGIGITEGIITYTGTVEGSNAGLTGFDYKWMLNEQIAETGWTDTGINSNSYTALNEEKGLFIKLIVTHSGYEGSIESHIFKIRDPADGPLPRLDGSVNIVPNSNITAGETLLLAKITGSTPQSGFDYEWQLSVDGENDWAHIPSAHSLNTYQTVENDGEKYIRVVVTHASYDEDFPLVSSACQIDKPVIIEHSNIPAVQPGGTNKYDLLIWSDYATAEQNFYALDLLAKNSGIYYVDGKFNPSWLQPGTVWDFECNFANMGYSKVYIELFDADGPVYHTGDVWPETDGINAQTGRLHNTRITYDLMRNATSNYGADRWTNKHPADDYSALTKVRIGPVNTSMVITKVTLRNVPLAEEPVGYKNPNISQIAGQTINTGGGNGTKGNPYTASITVPATKVNVGVSDITANYPMFSNAEIFTSTGGFDGDTIVSPIFLPEAVPTDVLIKMTAGDKATTRFYKISVTRTTGYVVNPDNSATRTIYSGSHTGTFNISKSGGYQYQGYIGTMHGTMDFEYIMQGGNIEVSHTGSAPQLRLRSDQARTGKPNDVPITGSNVSTGVHRYTSDEILQQIENNFGFENTGSRNPTIMAALQLTGAGSITKITVTYNPNDPSLRTFNTFDEMKAAASTFPGNTDRLKAALNKAKNGENITIAFLGGSITGEASPNGGYSLIDSNNINDRDYANRTALWFFDTYGANKITYINHGAGGNSSGSGVNWLDTFVGQGGNDLGIGGLLKGADGQASSRLHDPDIVFLEFAVNDSMGGWVGWSYGATMNTIISRVLAESDAAVIVLCSLNFDNGLSADVVHTMAAQKHSVSVVNHRAGLWPNIRVGKVDPVNRQEIARDDVHPNVKGHGIYADFIIHFLETIRALP